MFRKRWSKQKTDTNSSTVPPTFPFQNWRIGLPRRESAARFLTFISIWNAKESCCACDKLDRRESRLSSDPSFRSLRNKTARRSNAERAGMDGAWIDGGGHFEIAAEGIGQLDLAGILALGLG